MVKEGNCVTFLPQSDHNNILITFSRNHSEWYG